MLSELGKHQRWWIRDNYWCFACKELSTCPSFTTSLQPSRAHYRFQGFLKKMSRAHISESPVLPPSLVLNLYFTLQNSPSIFCLRYVHIKGHFLQCIGFHTFVGNFYKKRLIFLVINSSEHRTFNIFICNVLMLRSV